MGLIALVIVALMALALGGREDFGAAEPAAGGASVTAAKKKGKKPRAHCRLVVSSAAAAESSVRSVKGRGTVCLTDGTYDRLSLQRPQGRNRVKVRPLHSGRVTIDGASLSGGRITLARFRIIGNQVTVQPGSRGMAIKHNLLSGGYFGVDAGPTTSTNVNDVSIVGNKFRGPFGEDAIRINRYHDTGDPNTYGILIERNEFTNIRENGNHSDCLQSVWGGDSIYFRRNYLHDNRCQGFFIKDQPSPVAKIVFKQNLMLRNSAPCDPPNSGCGPPVYWQVFGPTRGIRVSHNTIWTPASNSPFALREGPFGKISITDNVIYRVWSDWGGGFPGYTEKSNTICKREGSFPALSKSTKRTCRPRFAKPKRDNYRLRRGSDGISWRPAAQNYGP